MAQWLERYLDHDYRIVRQRFVSTEPGFTASSAIGAKASQYVRLTLGGMQRPHTWLEDDYSLLLWNLSDNSSEYIAFFVSTEPVPATNEPRLVGYFQLIRSGTH
ncbi:MAG: hypothetical protein DI635_01650 [Pseudoxanthomonas suwonensis]|nr:MAG: hypothetical protein DI635_01650 [Pseudoxanthomonas suwonensis]